MRIGAKSERRGKGTHHAVAADTKTPSATFGPRKELGKPAEWHRRKAKGLLSELRSARSNDVSGDQSGDNPAEPKPCGSPTLRVASVGSDLPAAEPNTGALYAAGGIDAGEPTATAPCMEGLAVAKKSLTVTGQILFLRRFARALVGDPVEADDLVQECLTRALARKQKLAKVNNLRAYLFKVLYSAHVDRLADRRKRAGCVPLEGAESHLTCPPRQQRRLELREMAAALAKLPRDQRDVIILVGLEGLSYRDTAALLGIPVGTVMSRLFRAREVLRRQGTGELEPASRRIK